LAAIRVGESADRDYILWLLKFHEGNLAALGSGSTFGAIKMDVLKDLEVPLPPLGHQKQIASTLNEQMEAVETAREAAKAQREAAERLIIAHLGSIFNRREVEAWPKMSLREAGSIVSGITLGRKASEARLRSVSYLRVANVKDGYLDLSEVYRIEASEAEIKKWRLIKGDILLTEGGDPDKLGRGTFWEGQIEECIHQNHIFRLRLDTSHLHPEFIAAQLSSPCGKAYFLAHAKRTIGIATINQKVLGDFPLMAPSLQTQISIADRIREYLAEAEKMAAALREQAETIDKLPAAVLRQAFHGGL
jgi:type I restriction enzyme S subunit